MYLTEPAVELEGIGSVIGVNDAKTGKLGALLNRGAGRDYIDIDAMAENGTWPRAAICDTVLDIYPDIGIDGLAERLRAVVDVRHTEWELLNMTPHDIADLTSRLREFADWAEKRETHRNDLPGSPLPKT